MPHSPSPPSSTGPRTCLALGHVEEPTPPSATTPRPSRVPEHPRLRLPRLVRTQPAATEPDASPIHLVKASIADDDELPAGTRLGRHLLVRLRGEGGTCRIYDAAHIHHGHRAIARIPRREVLRANAWIAERMLANAALLADAPHILPRNASTVTSVISRQKSSISRRRPSRTKEWPWVPLINFVPSGHNLARSTPTSLRAVPIRARISLRQSGCSVLTGRRYSKPAGNSVDDVMDMSGNVWEWTASIYGENTGEPSSRTLRGGGWNNDRTGRLLASVRNRYSPTYRVYDLGFRCARTIR